MEATWGSERIALQKKHGSVFRAEVQPSWAGLSANPAQCVLLPGSQTRRSMWGRRGRVSRRQSTRRSGRTAAYRPRRTRWTDWPPGEASGRGTCGSDLHRMESIKASAERHSIQSSTSKGVVMLKPTCCASIPTFNVEGHFDRPPAGLLLGQQAELHRGAGRHLGSREVPVLPATTTKTSTERQSSKLKKGSEKNPRSASTNLKLLVSMNAQTCSLFLC